MNIVGNPEEESIKTHLKNGVERNVCRPKYVLADSRLEEQQQKTLSCQALVKFSAQRSFLWLRDEEWTKMEHQRQQSAAC